MTELAPVSLTARQQVLLDQVYRGKSNKEIGRACQVSPITVKHHLLNIFRKLQARNRGEAVYAALARGILKLPPQVIPEPVALPPPVNDWLVVGNLRLSPSMRCAEVAGRPLTLPRRRFLLLAVLVARPGMNFTRQRLLDYIVGGECSVEERAIDVHVGGVRRALEAAGWNGRIRTVVGHGYGIELTR